MSNMDKWNVTQNNYNTVENTSYDYFIDEDPLVIYEALKNNLKPVSFGFFLHRYVNNILAEKTSELFGDEADPSPESLEFSIDECKKAIIQSFKDNNATKWIGSKTVRLDQTVDRLLTAKTIRKREFVIWLGFGLNMPLEHVQAFLQKGKREQSLNSKDPLEAIAYYCFKYKYNYYHFSQLYQQYMNLEPNPETTTHIDMSLETKRFENELDQCRSDDELMEYLAKLITSKNTSKFSVTMQNQFKELYTEVLQDIANMKNADEKLSKIRVWKPENITDSDIINTLYASVPIDEQNNRKAQKSSNLDDQVIGYRLENQKISDVLNNKAQVNRFDLITLKFLSYALKRAIDPDEDFEHYIPSTEDYEFFIDDVNKVLNKCNLAPMYTGNVYECFILMCMLTEDPLGSFSEVFAFAYDETEKFPEKDPHVIYSV